MAAIRNNHKSPLALPTGVLIQPGKTRNVDLERVKDNAVVKAWLKAKIITVVDGDGEEEEQAPAAPKSVRVRGQEPAAIVEDADPGTQEDGTDAAAQSQEETVLSEDKDELFAELEALGYTMPKRTSVAKLQEAVLSARAEVAAAAQE